MQVIFTASPPSSEPVWSVRPEQVALRYVIGPATHRESRQLTHTQHDSRSRFVVDLAKSGKSFREIQDMVSIVYGDKSLKKTAIYNIMKKVKEGKNAEDLRGINTPKHVRSADVIAKGVQDYLTKRGVKVIEHPPYSPDLAPADFFLFPTLKKELAGITLAPGDFRKEWADC
jgi:hypothetical protein